MNNNDMVNNYHVSSISNGMKKTSLILSVLSFFAIASTAYAQAKGFTALAPIPNLTQGVAANSDNLASFFNNLYKYLIGLAATLAVIQIIWAGLEIAFNKEDVSKITDSKGKIYNAILGLVLVLSPVLVFSIINPSILNLSLNLPKLDTKFEAKPSTVTKTSTLTGDETVLRESEGGSVVFVFAVAQGTSGRDLGNILDGKQSECTQQTGGKGVILPQMAGGFRYVCQTCPPNTTAVLLPKGAAGSGPRGSCQQ